jgi:Ca-activated chloride channel family protein
MLAREGDLTRLDRARQEIQALLSALAGDRVGLVAFAGSSRLICPFTEDLKSFLLFLESLDAYLIPAGGTRLQEGIDFARDLLVQSSDRSRAIVLVTDGEDLGDPLAALAAAEGAHDAGIPVYSIMYGEPEGAKIPDPEGSGFIRSPDGAEVISRPNAGLLRGIAAKSRGAFVAACEVAFPMDYLYNHHLSRLPEQVRDELARPERENLFQIFLFAALALLLINLFIPFRRSGVRSWVVLLVLGFAPAPALAAPDAPAVKAMEKGIRLYQAQDYSGAQAAFEKAIFRDKENPDLWVNLGLAYLKQGVFEGAVHTFDRALTFPETEGSRAALFGAALARFRQGEHGLDRLKELEQAQESAALREVLKILKEARTLFAQCKTREAWPEEAQINLVLTNRLLRQAGHRLEQLEKARGQQKDQGVEVQGGDEGAAANQVEGGTAQGQVQSTGRDEQGGQERAGIEEKGQRGTDRPMTRLEKMRIFALLGEMEKERIALEKKTVKETRRAEGGRDW